MSKSHRCRAFGAFAAVLLGLVAAGVSAQAPELQTTYTRPNVNLRDYNQFMLVPLNLSNARVVPPPWVENADPKVWSLTSDNQRFLRNTFATAVREGIEEGGQYAVVDGPAPNTLQLEVRVVSLTPWAARDEQVETRGTGSLSFEAHVRDAQTGELLAIFEGTQQVGQNYQENTRFSRTSDITEHFTNWGRNVSRRLATRQAAAN